MGSRAILISTSPELCSSSSSFKPRSFPSPRLPFSRPTHRHGSFAVSSHLRPHLPHTTQQRHASLPLLSADQWLELLCTLPLFADSLGRIPTLAMFRFEPPRKLFAAVSSLALALAIFGSAADSLALVSPTARRLQSDELATVRLFRESTPSVVYITNLAVRQDVFTLDVMEVPQGSGSGFIWDKQGHVVTNYHVIRGASDLRVTLGDQSVYEADVVGYDEDKDVAVLHIDAPKDKLRPIPVGTSSDLLVGQKVYAIGNPVVWARSYIDDWSDQWLEEGNQLSCDRTSHPGRDTDRCCY